MSFNFGYLVEIMVSILLLLTILYCVRLNNQIRLLKADEQTLRATISELITATEIAERAIAGLKSTMHDGEQNLNERLEQIERLTGELDQQLAAGEDLLGRVASIANVARPADRPTPAAPAAPDAKAVAAAAKAFTERARARTRDVAA
jgi:septal ring-binding cell division protein DamX